MKKSILAVLALSTSAAAVSAHAEDPKVTLSGVLDNQIGIVSEDLDTNLRSHAFRNDAQVGISAAGKTQNGLGYGAVIDLEADVSADAFNQGINAARTYVYLDGSFGRTEFGSTEGVDQTMRVNAGNIARATGGINGDFSFFNSVGTGH